MSSVTSDANAVHLEESPSQSVARKHESSNFLQPAFQKAIERAAEKQAAADRSALKETGLNESHALNESSESSESSELNEAASHSLFERESVMISAGDQIEKSASSALAPLNSGVPQDYHGQYHRSVIPEMEPVGSSDLERRVPDDSAQVNGQANGQANGTAPASQRLDSDDGRSLETQDVVAVDGENHTVVTSELMASPQSVTSSASESPIARGGFDQQAFDTLSHMLSRHNSFSDSQAQALTLHVIAGMPGVESLQVQQDQGGQWHLQLQLNQHSRRPEGERKAELLAELSRRGHAMGSVSIFQPAGSVLAKQDI